MSFAWSVQSKRVMRVLNVAYPSNLPNQAEYGLADDDALGLNNQDN